MKRTPESKSNFQVRSNAPRLQENLLMIDFKDEHNMKRFDRIEVKLDEMSKTLAMLASIKEQLSSSFKRADRHEQRLDRLEDCQRQIERSQAEDQSKGRIAERAFWIVFTVIITAVVKFF